MIIFNINILKRIEIIKIIFFKKLNFLKEQVGSRLQKLNSPGNNCHPSLPTYWSHFTNPILTTAFRKEEEEKNYLPLHLYAAE
jgi:hypothetical protein